MDSLAFLRERSSFLRAVMSAIAGAAANVRTRERSDLALDVRNQVMKGLNGENS